MNQQKDIEKKYDFNNAQVYRLIAFFVAGAVFLTLIYAEFRYGQGQRAVIEERLNKKIKIINDHESRISKLETAIKK